jgi:Tol biopolymer transport system component
MPLRFVAIIFTLFLVACATTPPAAVEAPTPTPIMEPTNEVVAPPTDTAIAPTVSVTSTPPPSPTTQAILFASDESGRGQLYIMENGIKTMIPLPSAVESAWQPALHPDGQQILFTGRRNGQSDIALTTIAGQAVTWLTDHPADDFSPAWAWDGQRMAWVSEQDGRGHVWVKSMQGDEEPIRAPILIDEQPTRNPAFHPDGSLIYSVLNENGTEYIYQYAFEDNLFLPRVEWPYKGTQPAVNTDGKVAYVGWVENPPWRGIYTLSEVITPTLLWETTDWIGEPAWSGDGQWIFFSRAVRDGSGHDLWALPAQGGTPIQITNSWAWETDAVGLETTTSPLWLGGSLSAENGGYEDVPPSGPVVADEFIAGFNVAGLDNAYLSREVGFGWGKGFAFWERIEKEPGVYDWRDVDNTIDWYEQAGLKIFLRVDRTPTWARPADTIGSHPPTDMEAYARFLEALATRYKGRVAVYELWNEPNLSYEWGGQFPDPIKYVEMLRVARPALQRGDPDAKLVIGALAVTSTTAESMDDLEWMEKFYQALGPHDGTLYDAFSTHPYGFAQPPDFPPEQGLGLRRLEAHRAIMEKYGDTVPLWLTELGYPRQTPAWDLGGHQIWLISDELQAQYIADTLDYIQVTYPYVEAAFFFNLDFSTVDWYIAGEQMRAFAILDSARRPLPAYTRLRERALGLREN